MAWYRAGGGGIPSSLKTDMNDVLNKKFGTSQDYPPTDWAPTVNLMGPLPEKTVSGAIATFADGADAVPLKKCEITLPASLDGYSEVDVVIAGKNLADFSGHAEPAYSGLTITANADGSITFSGTPSRTWAHLTTDFAVDLPVGTYTLGRGASASYAMYIAVKYEDNTTENISMATSASKTFTTTKRIIQIRLDIATLNQSTNYNETVFVQLETGATMTDFEPYSCTTHTASLGRTIYGGTADVVNGQGTEEYSVPIALSSLTWTKENNHFYSNALATLKGPVNNTVPAKIVVSSPYTNMAYSSMIGEGTDKSISLNNSKRIYIYDSEVTDTAELETALSGKYLVGELATSSDFTFDPVPIDSKLGNNTIWSEQGDTEVTYRADINLALGGQ